jgi:hypothetical protein
LVSIILEFSTWTAYWSFILSIAIFDLQVVCCHV